MRSIRLSRTAVLGAPLLLAILVVAAAIPSSHSGDPWPLWGLSLAAGIAFFAVGITMWIGWYQFFASRGLELLVAGVYVCLGVFGIFLAFLLLLLANSCLLECV